MAQANSRFMQGREGITVVILTVFNAGWIAGQKLVAARHDAILTSLTDFWQPDIGQKDDFFPSK